MKSHIKYTGLLVLVWVLACTFAVTSCKKKETGPEAAEGGAEAAKTVRPEDDYYEAVNQKLLEQKEIPPDAYGWNWFYELGREGEQVKADIVSHVTDENNRYEDGSDEQKLRDLYRTAMDMNGRRAVGLGGLKPWLDRINQSRDVQEYAEAVAAFLRETGDYSLFQLFAASDLKDSGVYSWYLSGPDLGLGKETFADPRQEELVRRYQTYVSRLLACAAGLEADPSHLCLAGAETTALEPEAADSPYDRAAAEIVDFQRDMASAALPLADQWSPEKIGNDYTVGEIRELLSNLDVKPVLDAAGLNKNADRITVMEPELLKAVNSRLTGENLSMLKNYTSFCILQDFGAYLTPEIRDTVISWKNWQKGILEKRPDQKLALTVLEDRLGFELGKLYVQRTFSGEDKAAVENMAVELKGIYKERISRMEWMSADTREAAVRKLDHMTVKAGYPDIWPQDHSQAEILPPEKGGSLIGNVLSLKRAEADAARRRAGEPVDRGRWEMTPQTVNAYYNPSNNEIVFPAGILQPPFYDREASHASNMGGIGMVIAHEMSHAFDDTGAQYDEKGNFNMWWNREDLNNFHKLGDKVAAYYDKQMGADGQNINGRQTLGENIADLGALSCVTAQVGNDPEQLRELFRRYAVIWAEKLTEKAQLDRLNTDVHSPGKVRVNAVLRCTDAFYRAYPEVSEGDGMYLAPEERAGIW